MSLFDDDESFHNIATSSSSSSDDDSDGGGLVLLDDDEDSGGGSKGTTTTTTTTTGSTPPTGATPAKGSTPAKGGTSSPPKTDTSKGGVVSIDQQQQKAVGKLAKFNADYKDKQFGAFGTAVSKSLDELTKATTAFKGGDVLGGSAAVLRSVGALSAGLVVAAGPAGAAVGALIGVVTGLIALILEAMKPPSESLLSQIEMLFADEALKESFSKIKGGLDVWKTVESLIIEKAGSEDPVTWQEMKAEFDWQHHLEKIQEGFSVLNLHAENHSKEWMPLFELNVIYALRFWIYFEVITLMVCQKSQSRSKAKVFYDVRNQVAEEIHGALQDVHFASVKEVDFYSLWRTDGTIAYGSGIGQRGARANAVEHRIGVIDGPQIKEIGPGDAVCFAVAESGTIFSAGTNPGTLYFGRANQEWLGVPKANFGNKSVEQVAIGEFGNDRIVVVCVNGGGRHIYFCGFDDSVNMKKEHTNGGWSLDANRWGTWGKYDAPADMTILSVAVKPQQQGSWGLYAFALNSTGGGSLYEVRFSAGKGVAEMKEIPETHFGKQQLFDSTFNVRPAKGRTELSPCTITCLGDDLYLQVGNRICWREKGVWNASDADKLLETSNIHVYQARAYADGSVLFATNKGLRMNYANPKLDWEIETGIKDESIETIWFSKAVSSQAVTAKELLVQLKIAVKQPLEHFLEQGK